MQRLWAPWRLEYVTDESEKKNGCFFCNAHRETGREKENLVLYRSEKALVMLNRFPYNGGHLMVAPARHYGNFEEADQDEVLQMWELVSQAKLIMRKEMKTQGVNIGVNQGKCAGAGVLDHLHIHIVPRWEGDVNFMPVMTDIKVMPQALERCYEILLPSFESLKL